jgi:flagellar transcriptional activator FlhD
MFLQSRLLRWQPNLPLGTPGRVGPMLQRKTEMTSSNCNLSEIRALNLAYLQFARETLEKNRTKGAQFLGMAAEVAQLILGLSDAQQIKLASGSQMLCALHLSDVALLSGLAEKVSPSELAMLTSQAQVFEAVAA